MGNMKLFIYPPPRAGPVQACPSHFRLIIRYIAEKLFDAHLSTPHPAMQLLLTTGSTISGF